MDILKDWAIIEADFRREYGIDLTTARLSWRAFLVLLNGLSSNSVWVLTYQGRSEGDIPIEDDELAEKLIDRMF